MDLVIMAAGMGSRFGGLKQVEPIGPNGEFILDYSIYDAIRVGIKRVVFIIKEENYDLFRDTVGKRIEGKIQVEYVFQKTEAYLGDFVLKEERKKPWGTAHATLCCKDVVKDNFLLINADDFYGYESFKIIKEYMDTVDKNSYHFSMAGYIIKNTLSKNGKVKRGVCQMQNGKLSHIIESSIGYEGDVLLATRLSDDVKYEVLAQDLVSMNFFGFTPMLFKDLEEEFQLFLKTNQDHINQCEYLIPDVVQHLIDQKKCTVKVLKTPSVWHGVTYKEDKEEVVEAILKLIQEGAYPHKLWK